MPCVKAKGDLHISLWLVGLSHVLGTKLGSIKKNREASLELH